jgi:hypothetical protein
VKVYFQVTETYTEDDYLQSVDSINASMSSVGAYEIGNASVKLKNKDYYFSRKFQRELPNNKRVEIYIWTGVEEILVASGRVNDNNWQLTDTLLTLNINAWLLDPIKLRTTSVYAKPRDISPLQIVYGDQTGSHIPCTAIDEDGYIYHASDRQMQLITGVFVDGEPKLSGYKTYTAYQDETGHAIACVIFDEPQYEKQVSISGKGAFNLDTGELIENPADFMSDVMLNVQGYEAGSVDEADILRFYADCLKAEIKIADILKSTETIKELFDRLASNIHAHWLISDGKSVMQLRNVSSAGSPYAFLEADMTDFEITSEPLINEVTINYSYDFADTKYRSSITKHNPLSKLIYGDAKKPFDLQMLQTTRQVDRVADALLASFSIPQIIATFKHNFKSLHIEVGDPVTITHKAGLAENGYAAVAGVVIKKDFINSAYAVMIAQSAALYASELLSLTQVATSGAESITITYDKGVATITIYADVQGSPPVEGAEVTIGGVKKLTDKKGQARFNLTPGKYTAHISASGYEDAEIVFSV